VTSKSAISSGYYIEYSNNAEAQKAAEQAPSTIAPSCPTLKILNPSSCKLTSHTQTKEMKQLLNIASILAFFASIVSGQAALKYHVLAVTPGIGQGVNDKGDVVGTLYVPNPTTPLPGGQGPIVPRAFLYKGGIVTNLGAVYTPSAPLEYGTTGDAVNNSDIVVGNILNDGGNDQSAGAFDAFSWKNGVMTDIAQGTTDGGSTADAVGINAQGEAVGTFDGTWDVTGQRAAFGYPRAYVSLNGVRTDLGTLAGTNGNYSSGFAINNAGQVVGVSTNTNPLPGGTDTEGALYYAFLWSNGTMKAIGGAQSSTFAPTAINDNGWIAGTLSTQAGTYSGQAVLYVNSRFIPLGTVKGFQSSQSLSMNDLGMVVGKLFTGASSSVFVYNGVIHDLNTLVDGGWTITAVGKINIFGQIAATGTKAGSTTTYALLLTPSLF
jgi:probable HAF family extracellular repeat protein